MLVRRLGNISLPYFIISFINISGVVGIYRSGFFFFLLSNNILQSSMSCFKALPLSMSPSSQRYQVTMTHATHLVLISSMHYTLQLEKLPVNCMRLRHVYIYTAVENIVRYILVQLLSLVNFLQLNFCHIFAQTIFNFFAARAAPLFSQRPGALPPPDPPLAPPLLGRPIV